MSQYYNPKRGSAWNYGGRNWKLSRSKIDLFVECPKCFYVDNKLGTKRPPGYPFNLNSAVDHLLKKEFDSYRRMGTAHPLMEQFGIKAIPFEHENMDTWRENFEGVIVKHKPTGMTISGAVDDIWIDENGKLLIVDYKSTSKDGEITLDAEWQDGYKRQMEVYQWLLRQNNFDVSNTGYFVYANGIKDRDAFDAKLEFDIKIIPYTGSDSWVDKTINQVHECLNDERTPLPGKDCDYCKYRETTGKILQERHKLSVHDKKEKPKVEDKEDDSTKPLF